MEGNNKIKSDEIDIKDIFRSIWYRRKFILIFTVFFAIIGLFVALTSQDQYTAQSTILPQNNRNTSGNLGNFASIVGLNMGTAVMNEGVISTSIYPQIINSLPFAREIMQTEIVVEKSNGVPITLYEYYTNKNYKEINVLGSVKKYTIGLPNVIIASLRKTKNKQQTQSSEVKIDSLGYTIISSQENSVYNKIKNSIQYEYKQGVITLGYTFPEAMGAAQISEQLHKSLEKYVVSYKTQKAEDNLMFVEQSFKEAKKEFLEKQANLAAFQDANRGLVTATSRATETRLRSEYDISFTIYNELARQLEQARLNLKEESPVLTVINPVIVPLTKSAPNTEKTLLLFIFAGFLLSTVWVLIWPYFESILKNE
jgi:LPS O-antigen subunit length determinant protein (WzzB/FepE family)